MTLPNTDPAPNATPDANHQKPPAIDAYRIGWTTYDVRIHPPWQAEAVLSRCTCRPARGLTERTRRSGC